MADPKKNPLIGAFRAPVPGSVPPAPTVEEPKPAAPVQIADPKDKAVVTPAGPAEVKKPEEPPKGAESKGKAEAAVPTDPAGAKKPEELSKGSDPKGKAEAAVPATPAGAKKPEEPPKGSNPKGKAETAAPAAPAGTKKPEEPSKGSDPKDRAETAAPADPAGVKKSEEASQDAEVLDEDGIPEDFSIQIIKEEDYGKIIFMPFDYIDPFEDHPFPVRQNADMEKLAKSIKQVGYLEAAVVIPNENKPGRFEMVSGHRRMFAGKMLGLKGMPVVVHRIDRDEAIIAMVDSNLKREIPLTPMEKARAYTMKTEALRRKMGRRSKEETAALEASGKKPMTADQELAAQTGESVATVQRFKTLTKLTPPLQQMVDKGNLPVNTAADIAQMKPKEQDTLADAIEKEAKVPSGTAAKELKEASTNAGTYTVYYKATKANHNDVSGSVSVDITKATLTAAYAGEAIQYGQSPSLTVTVSGFVNGESAATAKGYEAPTVTADSTNVGQYTLTPTGGEADNYRFDYGAGVLTISSAKYPVSISTNQPTLTGSGTVTLTVTAAEGIQVSGVSCDDSSIQITGNEDGTYSAALPNTTKTYTFTVNVSGDMSNYEGGPATCTVSVTRRSSGGGGGGSSSSSSSSAVSVDSGRNGSVSVSPKNASKGTTVTITVKPDKGYEVDEIIVTDSKGNELKVTRKSDTRYTFTMPSGKVTVEASFVEIEDAPDEGMAFVDVPANAYYADAVAWAVENGITSGTSDTTFSPNAACTRAQMVTFLWRAAGSPKAVGNNPFTDLDASAYYYDAVLWAVSEGITSGTSATTFGPNATVTRGQTVTFLYRASGSPASSGNSFADVAPDAYYANAVAWAVSEGITSGTGNNAFSPDADCTRGQIVTFMYRNMA